ncbi:hypothetical protein [Streptomyces avermitilis]|uniref:hypothetical protein n=1 Tax=Streptomyces avermitilis TaxID=33903 RepID=UPI0037F2DF32
MYVVNRPAASRHRLNVRLSSCTVRGEGEQMGGSGGAHEDELRRALDRDQGLRGVLLLAQESEDLVYVVLLAAAFQAFKDERGRVGLAPCAPTTSMAPRITPAA